MNYFRKEVLGFFLHRHTPIYEGLDLICKSKIENLTRSSNYAGIDQSPSRKRNLLTYFFITIQNIPCQIKFSLIALATTRLPQVRFAKQE